MLQTCLWLTYSRRGPAKLHAVPAKTWFRLPSLLSSWLEHRHIPGLYRKHRFNTIAQHRMTPPWFSVSSCFLRARLPPAEIKARKARKSPGSEALPLWQADGESSEPINRVMGDVLLQGCALPSRSFPRHHAETFLFGMSVLTKPGMQLAVHLNYGPSDLHLRLTTIRQGLPEFGWEICSSGPVLAENERHTGKLGPLQTCAGIAIVGPYRRAREGLLLIFLGKRGACQTVTHGPDFPLPFVLYPRERNVLLTAKTGVRRSRPPKARPAHPGSRSTRQPDN